MHDHGFDFPEYDRTLTQATVYACAALVLAIVFLTLTTWRARGSEVGDKYDISIQQSAPPLLNKAAGVGRSAPGASGRSLQTAMQSCLPLSIKLALARADATCGITVISTFRRDATIAGTRHRSMHAICRAADFTSKDYACVYRELSDWRGKLSTDARAIKHVHIDNGNYARFTHGISAKRYAKHNRLLQARAKFAPN